MASPTEVPASDTKAPSETKAASPLINCGCQCAPLTFRDAKGVVQGNCLTVDSTGAQWCYVDTSYSSCPASGSPTTPGHTRPASPPPPAPPSAPGTLATP